MKLSSISPISTIFTIFIIVILYIIIFFIVKIMYKDTSNSTNNVRHARNISKFGIEIVKIYNNKSNFKIGGVIPVSDTITIGRNENNFIRLFDSYVSSYHAKIYIKKDKCFIKDLKSTNGTFVNDEMIDQVSLNPDDIIKIGENVFRVIG